MVGGCGLPNLPLSTKAASGLVMMLEDAGGAGHPRKALLLGPASCAHWPEACSAGGVRLVTAQEKQQSGAHW